MAIFTNRVYDAVAGAFVRWNTATPDTGGASYPGPDLFANTFDFCVESVVPASGGGITDHDNLLGLADDDHLQYVLLAGRAGGQYINGGTGPGDFLTLRSTTNGAPGDHDILLDDNLDLQTFDISNVGTLTGAIGVFGEVSVSEQITTVNTVGGAVSFGATTQEGDAQAVAVFQTTTSLGGSNPGTSFIYVGNRDPNSNVDAPEGSLYIRTGVGVSTVWIKNTALGTLTGWTNLGAAAATPAGANTEIQFNDSGVFGASSALTWDGAQLSVGGLGLSNVAWSVISNSPIPAFASLTGAGDASPAAAFSTNNGPGTNGSTFPIYVGDRNPNNIPLTSTLEGTLYARADQTKPAASTVYLCVNQTLPIWADLGSVVSTVRDLDIYVDPVGGDDNDSGSLSNPIATLAEAERRVPILVEHVVKIHLKNVVGYEWPEWRPRLLSKPIIVYADEIWDSSVYTVVYSGTCDAGTGVGVIVDNVGGLTIDAHRDTYIRMTSGAAVDHIKSVRNNTATDFVPYSKFGTAPAPGDTFEVFVSEVDVDVDAVVPVDDDAMVLCSGMARDCARGSEGSPGTFLFVGINFTGSSRVGIAAPALFFGCEAPPRLHWSTAHPTYFGCDNPAGTVTALTPEIHLGAPDDKAWRGWGISFSSSPTFVPSGGQVGGYWGLPNTAFLGTDVIGLGSILWIGGSGGGVTNISPTVYMALGSRIDSTKVLLDTPTSEAITAFRGGVIDVGLVSVTGVAGQNAIQVSAGGHVLLRGSGGSFAAEGSAPTPTISVNASKGGTIELIDGAPSFGRVGDNDYDVGNGFPQNKSFFAISGDHIAHTDGSVIRRE